MTPAAALSPMRRLLIGHGALMILVGGVIGFGFLFFLMGEISLWPFPGRVDYQLPGSYDAWRMAHMEAIVNGAILWILAAVLQHLPFGVVGVRRAVHGMLVVAWSIVVASVFDPLFPDSRGLAASDSLTNNIAFGLFYIGVVGVMILMGVIAYKALFTRAPE
ncbi:hypothetical protein JN531_006600 [Flagellatimonas centrodinii]|uniref:hypothetical protein n=1 Tax=Flagellatimonas centrodinii TaxID=2806210 RepID=UPI001FEDD0EA|nr:hypothetical protein [Flagellatimonas centrodinii]ULQ47955.1 hypothetical protein JN531_006600 [Flagellatimonas centrodinii]